MKAKKDFLKKLTQSKKSCPKFNYLNLEDLKRRNEFKGGRKSVKKL